MFTDPDFWHQIQDILIGERIPSQWLFDTVIVDEGQDFQQGWLDIVEVFQKDDSDFIWLEDQLQNISSTEPTELKNIVTYEAKTNYRSPVAIAQYIEKVLPFNFDVGNVFAGMNVVVHGFKIPKDQASLIGGQIDRLLKKGFKLSDITVVTCRGISSSPLAEFSQFGNYSVKKFTGNYDSAGEQIYQDGDVVFDSIYRFKGQESPAIILCDVSPTEDKRDHWEKILFCGMTRPTLRLEMLVDQSSPWYETLRRSAS